MITRQLHRKLARNVTVHLQPRSDSDHNILCATVRLPGRFARNRKQRASTGRKSIDRRVITSDADGRERLKQLVPNQLTQAELGGTVGEKVALFTDTLLRSAEEVMPGQIHSPVHLGCSRIRQYTPNLKKPGRRGERFGRRCAAP